METQNQRGIKETVEAIAGLKEIAIAVKKIAADGKLSVSDFEHVLALGKKSDVISAAVTGANDVTLELKDLTPDEIQEIVTAVLDAFKEIKAA